MVFRARKYTFTTTETVSMEQLINLSNLEGQSIRILERSSVKYEDIGIILLKSTDGAIVSAIRRITQNNPIEAARMVYQRWIEENEDHSWKTLIQCFREVELNALAADVEKQLGLKGWLNCQ